MGITRALSISLCLAVLSCVTASWASAVSEAPCAADVRRFCSGVKKGGGRIRDCLASHTAELSEPCKKNVSDWKPKQDGRLSACEGDLERVCAKATGGPRAKMHCLREHEASLSPGCRDALGERQPKGHHEGEATPPNDTGKDKP